jgi:DNA-binding transcriptional LysR family regulator
LRRFLSVKYIYRNNPIKQLRAFCAAAKSPSFSSAAAKVFLSQPTLSLQIRALEEEFGAALFTRGDALRLTAAGRRLFALAAPLLEEVDSLPSRFRAAPRKPARALRIAAGEATILYLLPEVLRRLRAARPAVAVELMNVSAAAADGLLKSGKADVALGFAPDGARPKYALADFGWVLIAPPRHSLASLRRAPTLAEIAAHPLILPPKESSYTHRFVASLMARRGARYRVAAQAGGWAVVKRLVEIGVGVAPVAEYCVQKKDAVAVLPLSRRLFPPRRFAAFFAANSDPAATDALIKVCRQVFARPAMRRLE